MRIVTNMIETRKPMNIRILRIVWSNPNTWVVESRKNGRFVLGKFYNKVEWIVPPGTFTHFYTKEEAEQCLFKWMKENLTEEEFDFEFADYIANKLRDS